MKNNRIAEKVVTIGPQGRSRSIYLLPNLLTTGALFAGFYAIVAGMKGQFEHAAIAIFVAMIMDGLDGRVARLTNTQSAFGAQYDSLSDMVCFGLTPALVTYNWSLYNLGKLGWLISFLYVSATALRLARFNIQTEMTDKNYFIGLSCTAAAGVVAGMLWVGSEFDISAKNFGVLIALLIATLAFLMVSRLKYYSFKEVDLRSHIPFVALLCIVLVFSIIAWNPPLVLFATFFIYSMFGPYLWVKKRFQSGLV
jgi:CDP-diacylglycerol--serine O-phosphatidyltransferase